MKHHLRVLFAFPMAAAALAGCATMQQTFGGWFGAATPTPTPALEAAPAAAVAPRVYYAGNEGLKVYSEPSTSSKVVGTLSLHEKVTRTKLEHGYAYVENAKGAVKGWVNNAQLLWRLPTSAAPAPEAAQPEEPAAPPAASAVEAPQEPQAPEPTATAAEPAPATTPVPAARRPKETPPGVAPSIFDAY